jgi:hypothetical protein
VAMVGVKIVIQFRAGRLALCFSMSEANVRSASFASSEVRNAAATSGSSTITLLPAAYLDAYLFGAAPRKSYSARISSGGVFEALRFIGAFFIISSFLACRQSCAYDANCLFSIHVHHRKHSAAFRDSQ